MILVFMLMIALSTLTVGTFLKLKKDLRKARF